MGLTMLHGKLQKRNHAQRCAAAACGGAQALRVRRTHQQNELGIGLHVFNLVDVWRDGLAADAHLRCTLVSKHGR
jgi:hypothetical protein